MNSLGEVIRAAKQEHKASLSDLTVLSPQNDPFRLDTPANHVKGRWFREHMEACGLFTTAAQIHNRGIHYAIVSLGRARLPDGSAYVNNAECWAFLEDASNTARWLGYVPWEKIIDARNAEPVIQISEDPDWPDFFHTYGGAGLRSDLALAASDIMRKPEIGWGGFRVPQPYHLVFFGEKTSLGAVLGPIASRYSADLYLPSGEISNTLLAMMAKQGAEDGREMIVFVFADCDPAGYQMGVSIGHKLRAMAESLYPGLEFRVLTPALTVEQVREHDLPSTPLKETEKRASGWRERYGVDQTEIDALATLRPDLLRSIVREAVAPFYDATLQERAAAAVREAVAVAQEEFDRLVDAGEVGRLQEKASAEVAALRETLGLLHQTIDSVDLTISVDAVAPELPEDGPPALVTSDMPLVEHIRVLRDRKDYGGAQ